MTIIDIAGVHWGYTAGDRRVEVLRDLQLSARAGEILALSGQSGSGKSSLLNLISGIEVPQRGRIRVGECRLDQLDEQGRTRFRRRHIGFVYQFFNLIPTLTVAENVALVQELNGQSPASAGEAARSMLLRVGLGNRAGAYPDVLSGGEQQRVAIARALIHLPMVLLADEPTGNLDARTGEQILDLLVEQARDAGSTLLLVTHSEAVARRADRVLVLVDGQLQPATGESAW